MPIKFKHSNIYSTYFITFTCIEWRNLFEITNSYDTVYNWFDILKNDFDAAIIAFVIMPNHLHIILHFHQDNFNLNNIISNAKRFMAYEIIKRLKEKGNIEMLLHLQNLVTEKEKKKGQLHKVFKESFDAKAIIMHPFLIQKINYIHHNPVSGKWMLAKDFVDYPHSSASFYELQSIKNFNPMHYVDL